VNCELDAIQLRLLRICDSSDFYTSRCCRVGSSVWITE
jgi:hypothetical protein